MSTVVQRAGEVFRGEHLTARQSEDGRYVEVRVLARLLVKRSDVVLLSSSGGAAADGAPAESLGEYSLTVTIKWHASLCS